MTPGWLPVEERERREKLIAAALKGASVADSQPVVSGYGDVDIQEVVLRLQDGREIVLSIQLLHDAPRIVPEVGAPEDTSPWSMREWRAMTIEDFPDCEPRSP